MTKAEILRNIISEMKRALVAYSGGVDSTYLLNFSIDALGKDNVLAVIASSETYPEFEKNEAITLCKKIGANYLLIETEEGKDKKFKSNPKNRCYYCKSELFSKLKTIAVERKFSFVVDGSNADDLSDYRPGATAKKELGIRSPLQEAGLTKAEIRKHSKELGLTTWDKPSYACLASRVPYGTSITPDILMRVDKAEGYLREIGFKQLRVRHHGNLARIEIEQKDIPLIMRNNIMDKINKKFEELGYVYVTLDLKGYRAGSMNEVL